jgi:type VI secretion system protein ImpJ
VLEKNKVLWTEGMFLQPQHFQQFERYIFNSFQSAMSAHFPYWYGISNLEINTDAISNGILSIEKCIGIMPDGVCFSIPENDFAPAARTFTEHFKHDQQSLDVYLALPLIKEGNVNAGTSSTDNQINVRYALRNISVFDEVMGMQKKEIEVGALNFSVLFQDESIDNHSAIKIGMLVRNASGNIEFSPNFIPPILNIGASPYLLGLIKSLLEFLFAKINSLSQGRKQIEGGFAEFSQAEETPFRLLQTLNTYTPLLAHYHAFPWVNPYELFCLLTQFAGSLCTFSSEVSIKNLPRYEHTNLAATFGVLIKIIRKILEADIEAGCVAIPIEQINQATYLCKITDDKLFSGAKFFLGISAKVPEKELVVGVLQRIKISSRNRLDLLISSAMPGLPLRHVMHPPKGLSTKPGFIYFILDQQHELWQQIKTSGNIAYYFPNSFPELKMEMLALKE